MSERNIRMRDLLQPPTAITATSLALVLHGASRLDTVQGKIEVIAGRTGDVIDGLVARQFDMSSDAGAIADVASDKIGMAALFLHAWQRNIVPKPVIAAMAARHIMSAGATLYNSVRDPAKRAIRPPKSGKLGMAADSLAIGAFLAADELPPSSKSRRTANAIGYTAAAAGLVFGCIATRHYIRGEFDEAEPYAD